MRSIKKIAFIIAVLLINFYANAQEVNGINEPVDLMRSNGKIYVVIAVVTTIVSGLFIYVINLDLKLRKLEKNLKD